MDVIYINPNDYKEHPLNPNIHPDEQVDELGSSLERWGQYKNVVVWNGYYLAGSGLMRAAKEMGLTRVVAYDASHLSEDDAIGLMIADNELPRLSFIDDAIMGRLLSQRTSDSPIPGVTNEFLEKFRNEAENTPDNRNGDKPDGRLEESPGSDTEPQLDRADELTLEWDVRLGDMWQLGPHKVVCGDSTDPVILEALMDGGLATIIHADPPYGMGKEKDGIANDNLYRDKLDAFQMQWWNAGRRHLEDNASAYIWGNAEDLWRLWYVGGLKNSERLTFRNQVIWDKGHGQGMESEQHRMYPTASEHCLFFMLGEQGFNNNADNYWEGWEPIRSYLKGELAKVGDIKWAKRTAGHSETSGCHWFDASQWTMPTEQVYKAWQAAAKGDAFKREYDDLKQEHDDLKREHDDLKQEFYATRAYFDNTHDNMTDVWQFPRVQGEERWGHATPKPVPMIERIIKTSSRQGDIVLEPFLGSGTTLIASHNINRISRGVELQPKYIAVTLQRFYEHTGIMPVRISTN